MMVMASVPGVAFTWIVIRPVSVAGSAAEIAPFVHDDTCSAVCVLEPTGIANTWQLVHWEPKSLPVMVMVEPEVTVHPGAPWGVTS